MLKYRLQPGRGFDELTDTIQQLMSDEVVAKDTQTIPRLPMTGIYPVRLWDKLSQGHLSPVRSPGKTFWKMYPIGKECKIRNIQVHGQNQDKCYAGQRVAINLSNVSKKEIRRGCVLAPKNSMEKIQIFWM